MLSPKYESYHEDVKYLQKALMPLGFDISSLKECPIRLVTEIRFYLMFMREHKYPNRKEFRKLLKSRQTFKTISVNSSFSQSNGDETTLTCFLFMYFWSQHQCENPDCNKFSYISVVNANKLTIAARPARNQNNEILVSNNNCSKFINWGNRPMKGLETSFC